MFRFGLALALAPISAAPAVAASKAADVHLNCERIWDQMAPEEKAKTNHAKYTADCRKHGQANATRAYSQHVPAANAATAAPEMPAQPGRDYLPNDKHSFDRQKVCNAKWQEMQASGGTGDWTHAKYVAHCMAGNP